MLRTRAAKRPAGWRLALFLIPLPAAALAAGASPQIVQDAGHNLVMMSDGDSRLALRLNYGAGCTLDRITVGGRPVGGDAAAFTGVRVGGEWLTTKDATGANVEVGRNTVTVRDLKFGQAGRQIQETWRFTTLPDRIVWRITRKYPADEAVDELAFPQWNFDSLSTWTGGMLDSGGVVWDKYLDRPNATYGGHFGTVTFWSAAANDCLRITPGFGNSRFGAGRFSRQSNGSLSFCYAISDEPLETQHGLSRFLSDRQDLWQPVQVRPSEVTAEFTLQAFEYDRAYDRGAFVGLDGNNVRELLNTVARYGVIDSHLVGGNGWRSGYICLHEPFFAQIAAALDAPDYASNLASALDFARDHAIAADGRVKSRWCYGPWDAMPGSYDKFGFYEAQWGYLLDSQPDYVMNVAELFELTGDRAWLARHKDSCERALEFLTGREVGDSGLAAMLTDSCRQNRGSDWIDIVWASYENAFVNAQLYAALNLWAGAEETLGDAAKAGSYRATAARIKSSFNRPTTEGGFWDSTNQWYVYWRDKDGSIHGNNLVTPVNFAAIAYGLCDDPARQKAILDRIEVEMRKEGLFYWPLCFFPYAREEAAGSNFPFPKYENGDIFLSWGELGVRAYAAYDPALALKYVKNTLDRYAKDGLSYQRYLRKSQQGEGDDILAGNCLPIVGLYRDIYGVQPQPDRLYLEPRLTRELDGTTLHYTLRGRLYDIALGCGASSITAGDCTVCDGQPFGVNATGNGLQYFRGASPDWTLSVMPHKGTHLTVKIGDWPAAADLPRRWTESATPGRFKVSHVLQGLKPNAIYRLEIDGRTERTLRATGAGQISFEPGLDFGEAHRFEIVPVEGKGEA